MDRENNLFSNIIRPLNDKHVVSAIVAFVLDEAGRLLIHEDATDSEALKDLKKKVFGKNNKKAAPDVDPDAEIEGDDLAGKAD